MFVRLAFAVIAHVDADILVIDEALAVGDAFFNQKCFRFLDEFKKRGTILFVSHDTFDNQEAVFQVIWIDRGHVMARAIPRSVRRVSRSPIHRFLRHRSRAGGFR